MGRNTGSLWLAVPGSGWILSAQRSIGAVGMKKRGGAGQLDHGTTGAGGGKRRGRRRHAHALQLVPVLPEEDRTVPRSH